MSSVIVSGGWVSRINACFSLAFFLHWTHVAFMKKRKTMEENFMPVDVGSTVSSELEKKNSQDVL